MKALGMKVAVTCESNADGKAHVIEIEMDANYKVTIKMDRDDPDAHEYVFTRAEILTILSAARLAIGE